MAGWPIRDSTHLILHVAHPKFFRSGGNVPLHIKGGDDCDAQFKAGADTCWQGMTSLSGQAPDWTMRAGLSVRFGQ